MNLVAGDGGSAAKRSCSARGRFPGWVVGFLIVFGLLATWSLATPDYAAPDEPAHAFRAASLVRGQILGQSSNSPKNPSLRVSVPATLAVDDPHCFAFKPAVPASCMPAWRTRPGSRSVYTPAGRYPPLYYFVVGLPSLITTGGAMLLWMRVAGDLLNAMFLTVGFVMLVRSSRSSWALVGGVVAVTPMVLFIGSVLNPNGLEICSAVALWSALLALIRAPGGRPTRSTVVWGTTSAVVFESTRGLSPVFMGITVLAVLALAGLARVRLLVGRRDVRVATGVTAAFGVLAAWWVLGAGALRLTGSPVPTTFTLRHIVKLSLQKNTDLSGLVGTFGWLDTPPPGGVVSLWLTGAVLLLVVAAASGARRDVLVVVALIFATILIPAIGDITQARTVGMVSQARYILPVAVGVPIVAGLAVRWHGRHARFTALAVMAALGLGQIAVFIHTLQRYRTGLAPEVAVIPKVPVHRPEWIPPMGSPALITVFIITVVCFQVWLWQLTRRAVSTSLEG